MVVGCDEHFEQRKAVWTVSVMRIWRALRGLCCCTTGSPSCLDTLYTYNNLHFEQNFSTIHAQASLTVADVMKGGVFIAMYLTQSRSLLRTHAMNMELPCRVFCFQSYLLFSHSTRSYFYLSSG